MEASDRNRTPPEGGQHSDAPLSPQLHPTVVRRPLPDIAAMPTIPRVAPPSPTHEQIMAAINAFVGAPTYDETRTVLAAQQATLFHRDTLLALLLHARSLAGKPEQAERLQLELLHLGLLLIGRDQGIAAAWQWKDQVQLDEMLQRLKQLPTDQQRRIGALFAQADEAGIDADERARRAKAAMRALTEALRADDTANSEVGTPPGQRFASAQDALQAFLAAPTWSATFDVLAANQDLLLHAEHVQIIQQLRAQVADADAKKMLQRCADILERAITVGVAAARGELLGAPAVPNDATLTDGDLPVPNAAPVAPSVPPAPIASVSPLDPDAVVALLAGPHALDDATTRALRAWLGEGDASATPDEMAAALERIRPLLDQQPQ